jgi:hypothetical protein
LLCDPQKKVMTQYEAFGEKMNQQRLGVVECSVFHFCSLLDHAKA